MIRKLKTETRRWWEQQSDLRRGAFMVLAVFALVSAMGFVALSVDMGVISLTKVNLQKAADMAALAAAQEIIASVETAAANANEEGGEQDVNSISIAAAKAMAETVADLNGVYVNPDSDVVFGKRTYDEDTDTFNIEWGTAPFTSGESFNVVKVIARRNNPDVSQPDGELELFFASIAGNESAALQASAVAFVEARDIVTILDYSGSMNDDSELKSLNHFGREALEANMEEIFDSLQSSDFGGLTFTPEWLTVEGPDPASESDAKVFVTFRDTEVDIDASKPIQEVTIAFQDGGSQYFGSFSDSQATLAGTGDYDGEGIDEVWVKAGDSTVTVSGQPASGKIPHITVTFMETSIYVESTKKLKKVTLNFSDGMSQQFTNLSGKTGTFSGTGVNSGKTIDTIWVKSGKNGKDGEEFDNPGVSDPPTVYFVDNYDSIKEAFDLTGVSYPYNSGSWNDYIYHVKTDSNVKNAGYRKKYGGLTLVNYLLSKKPRSHQTYDLYQAPAYPFHAMKNGMTLFLDFLDELDFGDHVGLVSYDSTSRMESGVSDSTGTPLVDLGNTLITDDYEGIDIIQRRKQAGHYDVYTGMGYGIETAITMMSDYQRFGARPTLILMTDGNANRYPSGWSLPGDWDWDQLTDFDGDGSADYSTNSKSKQYAFYQAKEAIDQDMIIHTLTVGAGADRDLMKAIAWAGNGQWIDVPGGSTIEELEDQMLDAFAKIAANVPPAKLLHDEDVD